MTIFMNKRLLEILDYFKIKDLLEKELFTFSGKRQLQDLLPSSDFVLVEEWQKETTEMKKIFDELGHLPIIPLEKDITTDIKQAQVQDNILNAQNLVYIARILECCHQVKDFLAKVSAEKFPLITKKAYSLKYLRVLEREIKNCLNEEAEIKDEASPVLKKVRQKIHSTEKKIREVLERIIRNPENRTIIQDDIITIRQGRYVIPVKQQEKGKFQGVIHDKSESGVTVFMEPLIVVNFNNELRELRLQEKKEEYKILQRLTALVGQSTGDILSNYQYLGELDLIAAKAEVSRKMNALEPKLNVDGHIRLWQARHPLLKGKVVPIDMEIGEKYDILIITGPNTGGKTVTLKTVGLLHLMAQSGLHIPVAIDSEVTVFQKIFADIGDEQSMEQNLSTFSSHMKNIISILNAADHNSLILLDELGAGTDPSEGSALAMAILDLFKTKGAKVLSTTHHDSLKAYAYLTERVRNARVEFDEKTLQPIYKLSIGLPGKSCAFSVAQRLGLSEIVLEKAKNYLEKEKIDLENLIKQMENDKAQLIEDLKDIKEEKKNIEKIKEELKEDIRNFEKEKLKIKLEAYQEAERILTTAQNKAKEIINFLKKKKAGTEEFTEEIKNLDDLKKEIKNQAEKYNIFKETGNTFTEGESVFVKSLQKEGIIIDKDDKKQTYMVQVGNLKLKVSVNNMQKLYKNNLPERNETISSQSFINLKGDRINKKANFKSEIDIRHMTACEASIRLEKYLDDAFLLNISPVYIIHGKGRGILRNTVTQLLKKLNYIKSYRYGEVYEGGDGVTIVYF
uniref:Endonuclease MutS2 n=1 Tax=uncultured Atribacterota bacterium TaxID=263865 RepID=G3BMS7_9BACT|nr:mismatch repair ATPase [uncultured Atribacterota bacterium]